MNIALWIAAGILAAVFLASGVQKLIRSREQLAVSGMTFARHMGDASVRTIGILEILAAAGLILPAALGVLPILVPVAAGGLMLLMLGATVFHLRVGEVKAIAVTVTLAAVSAAVAVGRFGPESFGS